MRRVLGYLSRNQEGDRLEKRALWGMIIIGVVALALRVVYVFISQEYTDLGADEMQRAAISLARDGYIGGVFKGSPGKSAHVAPLYAAFLGGIYKIFGWNTVTGRLVQDLCACAVSSIGICLFPLIAKRMKLPMEIGWVAAIFLALQPLNLWNETSGSWEQPYSMLMLLVVALAFCRLQDEEWSQWRTILLTGLLLGAAALLSPSLLPAVALLFASEWIFKSHHRKRIVTAGLTMMAMVMIIITPWVIRNYYALGGFIPVRSNFGLELAIGNNPQATGKTFITYADDPNSPAYNMHPNSSNKERARMAEIGELAYMREKQHMAVQWMKEHPGKALELTLARFRFFWFPPEDEWPRSSNLRLYKSLFFSLIGLWMFGELTVLILSRHPRAWLLACFVIGPSLIYMVTHADPRYRYPVFGLSALLACHFCFRAYGLIRGLSGSKAIPESV
ncbi:MAG TPA: hypothetical protein VJ302_07670 [Blastocatellia bacterium]|nr:hypothetical protein [Blastocatellia bacterium]